MAAGGIRDHLAGGFHRYSVDARWLVPHFEKMLYDNALLARAYLDAYRVTGAEDLRRVCEETLDYILTDLRSEEGGFYAARDADSDGEEGRYYLWTRDEVVSVLPTDLAALFMRAYDVASGGNFEGKTILNLPHPLDSVAASEGLDRDELDRRLAAARGTLLGARDERRPPLRDEKILAGWNGMALRALAEAGGALERPEYISAAVEGMTFLLEALRPHHRLRHSFKDGEARVGGFLEDHGALGNGLLSLHEATFRPRWLEEARWCCEEILTRFWDEETGVFFDTTHDGEPLFMRPRDPMDNATPSGTSLAAELLLRAGHLFGEDRYAEIALRALRREVGAMRRFPTAFGRALSVLDRRLTPPVELAVVGDPDDPRTRGLAATGLRRFHRNLTLVGRAPWDVVPGVPVLEGREALDGHPTAYLCQGYACRLPVHDPEALETQWSEHGT
jgi:uncharacterized protein YyaL (SSP411 family)